MTNSDEGNSQHEGLENNSESYRGISLIYSLCSILQA